MLSAREFLDDLGMHTQRGLKVSALSARRIEHLEARMFSLEENLEALITRGEPKPSKPVIFSDFDNINIKPKGDGKAKGRRR